MTEQQHPITPPPELVEQWYRASEHANEKALQDVATQAARWGADRELDACISAILSHPGCEQPELFVEVLRVARRPKLLSLKKQALKILDEEPEADDMKELIVFDTAQVEIIRRALEQLDD